MINSAFLVTIAYGFLALVGGMLAYKKVGSKASLISGSISGVLLLLTGILQLQNPSLGVTFAEIITGGLIVVFTIRLIKTKKLMPAGLMLTAGLVSLGVLVSPSI